LQADDDHLAALQWFNKASSAGDDLCAYYLAAAICRAQSQQAAETCFRLASRAADSGVVDAEARLGQLFHEGFGVERSASDVAFWPRRASIHGHPGAQALLAGAYDVGAGVSRDRVQAGHCALRSAQQGNELGAALWRDLQRHLAESEVQAAIELASQPLGEES
jgi:TPR repeat protein